MVSRKLKQSLVNNYFGMVSLFEGTSNVMDCFMPKLSCRTVVFGVYWFLHLNCIYAKLNCLK